jgi:hypothetical protein
MKKLFFIATFLSLHLIAVGQTQAQRDVIKSSMSKEDSIKSANTVKEYEGNKAKRVEEYLKTHPKTKKTYTKNGKFHSLSDISKEGKPIYIVTKKTKSKTKSKAKSKTK